MNNLLRKYSLKVLSAVLVLAAEIPVKAALIETYSMSPNDTGNSYVSKAFLKPARNWVSFGASSDRNPNTVFLGRYGVSTIPLKGTILENTINISSNPVCGPSPKINTLVCHNTNTGELLQEFPIPGNLSTQPVFFDGSWFFGTSKGFFIRTEGTSLLSTPLLGGENTGYWGTPSRRIMKALKPLASLDAPEKETDPRVAFRKLPRAGWRWYATTATEFVGTPLLIGNQILVLTAQQYLLSLDTGTGKTLWSVRLAPETTLRLDARSLVATTKEILVGTDDGQLMAINPKDGAILWRHLVSNTGRERYRSVVAPPTSVGRSVFLSNAESQTIRLGLDGRAVEWTYPLGSVAQTKVVEDSLILGGNDGTLVSLDPRSGALRWKVALSPDAPLASVTQGNSKETLLAADKQGRFFQVRLKDGTVLDSTAATGEVVGEFLASNADQCISYADNGFRCFVLTDAKPMPKPVFAIK